ncbi:Mitochondrial-type heat shock protein 70 [Cucumispora dikerogammari]|nr:Mitochondrial-type heat shock protein 70 [Cucumispora dikerogammari]
MAYGIDLGTTNTVISKLSETSPHTPIILKSLSLQKTTPSIVYIPSSNNPNNNEILVGEEAKPYLFKDPTNTITSVKRLIGKKFDEIKPSDYNYKIVPHINKDAWIENNSIKRSPSEISSLILKKVATYIKNTDIIDTSNTNESNINNDVKNKINVVITVPAYFNESQRLETKKAYQLAGLNPIKILNEPTAAALAYGIDTKKDGIIAVYDLGGGTFDISILKLKDGIFEVLSTNGDTQLGGDDIDINLGLLIKEKLEKQTNRKLRGCFLKRLKVLSEKIKIDLSKNQIVKFKLPNKIFKGSTLSLCDIKYEKINDTDNKLNDETNLTDNENSKTEIIIKITRNELQEITKPLLEKTKQICLKALKDAKVSKSALTDIFLVGGQTKMPLIRSSIQQIFGKPPSTHIDPDEAVAKGAALQAGILENLIQDTILLDVSSLSLGIETIGGMFSPIIPRNTPLPTMKTEEFTTSVDNQETVDINVYQGENKQVKDNVLLGEIKLKNIEKRNAGIPRIKVMFLADTNGILKVEAEENDKIVELEVIPSVGLSDAELNNLLTENDKYKPCEATSCP